VAAVQTIEVAHGDDRLPPLGRSRIAGEMDDVEREGAHDEIIAAGDYG
jgi:hypothetical protein